MTARRRTVSSVHGSNADETISLTQNQRTYEALIAQDRLTMAARGIFEEDLHFHLLVTLWTLCFPGEPFARVSDKWKTIGFQGNDPVTDLRGCGLVGLAHLEAFIASGQGPILTPPCPPDFPLAIASINITGLLVRYLGLNPRLALGFRVHTPPEHALQHFLYQAVGKEDAALQELHSTLLNHLIHEWTRRHTPATTVLDFPVALQATSDELHRTFCLYHSSRPQDRDQNTLVNCGGFSSVIAVLLVLFTSVQKVARTGFRGSHGSKLGYVRIPACCAGACSS